MAIKKIGDLTLKELNNICLKNNCKDCPFARFVLDGEYCPITHIGSDDLEEKIEV